MDGRAYPRPLAFGAVAHRPLGRGNADVIRIEPPHAGGEEILRGLGCDDGTIAALVERERVITPLRECRLATLVAEMSI